MNCTHRIEETPSGSCTACADEQALLALEEGLFEADWLWPVLKALDRYATSRETTAPLILPPQALFDGEGQKTILLHYFHEGAIKHFCVGFPLTPQQIETATREFLADELDVRKDK